ncbi:MAG: enoyl-CoA hydratase [Candidatus Marinimicrobia bacterium]|nr:enoyl-CoA hydratase [Candidatus Neomarinimicrobiota bacterium]|tara:strand:+ start:2454 stop:3206 length:753 start_codon:yes stop_codon:yes gene_type:complete
MIDIIQEKQIQILKLNRPKVNAINEELIQALSDNLDLLESNNNIKGIIITGENNIFSAGLDLIELYSKDRDYMNHFWSLFSNLLIKIYSYPKIVFTAISGHSPAGGTVISIMTDYRIMSRGNFLIGLNEVAVGLSMPISIGRVFQSLLGERVAEKMTLKGQLVNPEKAQKIGLIDEVVESEKLLNYTVDTMQQWLKLPYQKQIASKLSLRKNVIDIMKKANKDNDEFINAWFSDECRSTMKSIISKLSKK